MVKMMTEKNITILVQYGKPSAGPLEHDPQWDQKRMKTRLSSTAYDALL